MERVIVQKLVIIQGRVPDGATNGEIAQEAARIQRDFRAAMGTLVARGYGVETPSSRMAIVKEACK